MPAFLAFAATPVAKAAIVTAAKKVGGVLLMAGTAYVVDYAKARGKEHGQGTKKNPKDIYNTEYAKNRARYDAERDSRASSKYPAFI